MSAPRRTRIKFCGMTRAGDVRLAGELGVDAVGFVFAEGSPRRLTPAEARQLRLALAPMVSAVALFRDNTVAEVREVVRQVRPALLQFHGDEDETYCRQFARPYVKAARMKPGVDLLQYVSATPQRRRFFSMPLSMALVAGAGCSTGP